MIEEQYWWVSDHNRKQEVLGENHFPEKLKFYDTTLRDGEQTIGVSWDKHDKLRIAKMLDGLGIDRIEAGMPVVSREDREAVELIQNEGLNAEIWGFCRAIREDIDACIDSGIKYIMCEIATSDIKLKANKFTREKVLARVADCLEYAKSKGLYTAFFAVDATRTDLDFLHRVYKVAVEDAGADEVVMVDTLGVATPETVFFLTQQLKEWVNVPVSIHCHNDFGMATACTIFGAKAGAEYVQGTINGLGEKTGNVDLAEIAIVAQLYGMDIDLDLKKLYKAAQFIAEISGIPISPLKPVTGENVFKRESGVTVAQLINYPPAVEGFSPEILGREREVLLSKKSGKKSVEYKLELQDIKASSEQVGEILQGVKELGLSKKGLVTDAEFNRIIEKVMAV